MNKMQEFWYCVAPQEDLPLPDTHTMESNSCQSLLDFLAEYKVGIEGTTPLELLTHIILDNPKVISDIRVLVGVSDKRLYLDLTYLANIYSDANGERFVEEPRDELRRHDTKFFVRQLTVSPMKEALAREIASYFLTKGLDDIMDTFINLREDQIIPIFNNLIAPKEVQQMQAKLRGHGAEQAFAQIIMSCRLDIIPEDKGMDPMAGYDPNVDLSTMQVVNRNAEDTNCHSFDIIVPDSNGTLRVLIQSLIHSSDPGQYGVNKSDETVSIRRLIDKYNEGKSANEKVYMLGSVDGVGFCENPNGTIVKMIDEFDDFVQIHTLFKIPLFLQKIGLINDVIGVAFDDSYFEQHAIEHFVENYLDPIGVRNMTGENTDKLYCIGAGKATIIFDR